MNEIQSNLINFSKMDQFLSIFEGRNNEYPLFIDKYGVVYPIISKCPHCGSKMNKNGYNRGLLKKTSKFDLSLKKGKLKCSNDKCNYNISTEKSVFVFWEKCLGKHLDNTIIDLKLRKLSSPDIAKHIENVNGIKISDEFVRLKSKKLLDAISVSRQHNFSGVLIGDEEFVKSKGIDLKRISIVDANNPNVYSDRLHLDRSHENILDACLEAKKYLGNVKAVVLDGFTTAKSAYKDAFGSKILIQNCLFHFLKNVRDAYKQNVGYGKGKSILPLQDLINFYRIANVFFNHDREIYGLINIQKTLIEHKNRIESSKLDVKTKEKYIEDYDLVYIKKAYIFLKKVRKVRRRKDGIKLELRNEEDAKSIFEELKTNSSFPKDVNKQIKRLTKDWLNFTHCMRNNFIPPTSNKVEQYYSLSLNWIEKNNLQSEDDFYFKQKINLIKRYNIPFVKEGSFQNLLKITAVMLLFFG